MAPRLSDSPAKLILLAFAGCLIASLLFLAPQDRPHDVAAFFIGFVLFAGGAVLSLKSTYDLGNGVENELWPDSQLEPFRRHFKSPLYTVLGIVLLIAYILLEFGFSHLFRGQGWVCFLVLQTLSQIRIAFRPPRPSAAPPPDWRSFAPIRSDHWGQP